MINNPWTGSAPAALLRDISDVLSQMTIPPPVAHPKAQTVTRYGITYCVECGYAIAYCPGHQTAGAPAKDGAETGLKARIAECKGK